MHSVYVLSTAAAVKFGGLLLAGAAGPGLYLPPSRPKNLVADEHPLGAKNQLFTNNLTQVQEPAGTCPKRWVGDAKAFVGSCWCGWDEYCMCTPSLAIDTVVEVTDPDTGEVGGVGWGGVGWGGMGWGGVGWGGVG